MDKLKVILVDDEVTILEGFKRLFDWDKYGFQVIGEATDGAMAINLASALHPDLMIVDVNIPIISGLEVVEILSKKFAKIKFIIVSGYDEFEYCRKALRLNVADYLLKPVNFDEFGRVIDKLKVNRMQEKLTHEISAKKMDTVDSGELILRMTSFIQENLAENLSLQRLSEEFHLNSSYISQMFKGKTGMNYHHYLEYLRIMKANTLLTSTARSISDIASCVGFRDYRVFTKVYKHNQGMSPSLYRKLNSKECQCHQANNA